MSRLVRTPKYAVYLTVPGYHLTPFQWRVRKDGKIPADGRPTTENLAAYVAAFEHDCVHGVNKHLGPMVVKKAKIVDQERHSIVATYEQPMFSVVS